MIWGKEPLFTLVCVSVRKTHQFCLYETYICLSCEWWSWQWFFPFTDLPCIISRKVGELSLLSGICLASQQRRRSYMNWKRRGGEENKKLATLREEKNIDQANL